MREVKMKKKKKKQFNCYVIVTGDRGKINNLYALGSHGL